VSVWLAIPSARPTEEANRVLAKWRERGYKIALWRDAVEACPPLHDVMKIGAYPGYARATNELIRRVMELDPSADWFLCGGDDVEPDPNHTAEEIARECSNHFAVLARKGPEPFDNDPTFGVMQPTGHRWGDSKGAYIDRVAGSPWMGREFCKRTLEKGIGPLWPEFEHMFVDETLREVAIKLGIYWERPDLTHFHNHWGLQGRRMPEFLQKWNTREHWAKSKAIFTQLKAEKFSRCLP
jgi:hypothetical protein